MAGDLAEDDPPSGTAGLEAHDDWLDEVERELTGAPG
jgi:hypothetical protein